MGFMPEAPEKLTSGEPLTVDEGTALVPVGPFETVTVAVRLAAEPALAADQAALPEPALAADRAALPEPAQPLFTRYWLHGKGPAPAGNVPVAVHFSPTRVTLGADGDAVEGNVTLTVASGPAGGRGTVELVVPEGLGATVAGPALSYDLPPNGYAAWDVAVRALPGTGDGRYFIAARITDDLGQVLEDAVLVTIGEAGEPDLTLEPEELFFRLQSDVMALADEVRLEALPASLQLAPGASCTLEARVASRLASQLRGEAQLVSPVGTWQGAGPWTQPVTVSPGGEATMRFDVTVPATAAPGWESWLLVKLMYFGRVCYSEAVRLTVK